MKKTASLSFLSVLLVLSAAFAGQADYTDRSFARLSYITGNAYVQRAADLGYEEGVVNMPITQGDRLGTADGRVEIYMGSGTYLRLDQRTKLDFLNLPRRGSDLTRMRLWSGNAYLSIRRFEEDMAVEIHTSDVSIYILDRGLYRIDVRENFETEIFVFRGMAEAAGDNGSVLLKRGQRLEAMQGHFTSDPSTFVTNAIDSFDRWSDYREDLLRQRLARAYMPEELVDFEYELAVNGRWNYISPYGYVWIPGAIGSSWRPYYHGRWIWYPLSGWTWLPYEEWGWVTFHYGRWHWRLDVGWYWIPTRVWGPAWVNWYVGGDIFGWAPMTYYGRPAVIINNHFYANYSGSDYPRHSRALTVVSKKQLSARDIKRVALPSESLADTSRIRLSRNAPDPGPSAKRVSIQRLEKDKLFLRVPDSKSETRSGSKIKSPDSKKSTSRSPDPVSSASETPRRIKSKDNPKSRSTISKFYDSITGKKDNGSAAENNRSSSEKNKSARITPKNSSSKKSLSPQKPQSSRSSKNSSSRSVSRSKSKSQPKSTASSSRSKSRSTSNKSSGAKKSTRSTSKSKKSSSTKSVRVKKKK
jgi:hypothetical protein